MIVRCAVTNPPVHTTIALLGLGALVNCILNASSGLDLVGNHLLVDRVIGSLVPESPVENNAQCSKCLSTKVSEEGYVSKVMTYAVL